MTYMAGDYMRGDYMRGDPGIFDFFKKIASPLLSVIPGGGAIKTIVGGVGALLHHPNAPAAGVNPSEFALQAATGQGSFSRTTVGPGGMIFSRTTGEAQFGTGQAATMAMVAPSLDGRRRTHPNRSTYVTRGGGTSRWPHELELHQRGTVQVTARRMNVANGRALRRALRRVAGFGKLAKRSRRAVSMAASSLGVRHRVARRSYRR